MTRDDPFTSSNARVIDPTPRQINLDILAATRILTKTYGPTARVEYKKYFGSPGLFRAGYESKYGFHLRGSSDTSAQEAADHAITVHSISDPTPAFPDPMTCWKLRASSPSSHLRASSEAQGEAL